MMRRFILEMNPFIPFSFEFENISLQHLPAGERKDHHGSCLWLSVGSGSLAFDVQACRKLHGKAVVVEGTLLKPDPSLGGAGHMSLWPAELLARSLTRA